ncbi:MAG: acyl-CoA-binding protein [Anaerolineales bacterium]|nr:acyl-CoA-binding protein [Anaerolineales bacterium]
MSDDLQARFETAAQEAQKLPKKPDNTTLIRLYALYKQATAGNVTGSRPGMADFVGRAKYDAREKLKNYPKDKAMQDYIALVEKLKKG